MKAPERFGLPLDTHPMEARPAEFLPQDPGEWQCEPKWDGFRCLVFRQGGDVELRGKSGKPLGRYFPEVLALLGELPSSRFVADAELVIEIAGRLSFDALQMRLHPAESRIRKLARETPATLVLFDMLLSPQGVVLIEAPLTRRRLELEAFGRNAAKPGRLQITPVTRDVVKAQNWLAGYSGTDGVVAKRLDGAYESGERAMIKVKRIRTADCVVGGFRYGSHTHEVGSLLLGLYDEQGKLDHVGFTATIAARERAARRQTSDRRGAASSFRTAPSAQMRSIQRVANGKRPTLVRRSRAPRRDALPCPPRIDVRR